MKIALAGTGQMGAAVEAAASARGHVVASRFNSQHPVRSAAASDLAGADVIIDFSLPDLAVDHIGRYVKWGVPAVIGTTGWYDQLDEARSVVDRAGGSVLYAANFSLGVALLSRALQGLLPLLDRLDDFDVFLHEVHHTRKVDSPSGTAVMLGQMIVDGLERKSTIEAETVHGKIGPQSLHITSTRAGHVFGRHTIGIDGLYDEVTLEHRAKSRNGFGLGAVRAAEWLVGRTGFYSLNDALDDWMRPRTS